MPTSSGSQNLQFQFPLEPLRRTYTVSELNAGIQALMEREFRDIVVSGEISGCKIAASGHYYFSLKDESSQLRCALFKGTARYLRFKPQDGLAVLARGSIAVYEVKGEYQLLIESLEPLGAGALQLAFEQLKKKLSDEGLFDSARKMSLPRYPRRIGIITSPTGAVIRDMLHILERRFPGLHIRLFPAQVQGEGAADQVCAGLRHFSRTRWPEVVILARGGGSLEDLWTFNEEAVARAIAACPLPVISAIGHETDFTISDFVADKRAPTPSAAAEIVVCTKESLLEQIAASRGKAIQALRYRLMMSWRELQRRGTQESARIIHRRITSRAQRVDEFEERLRRAQRVTIEDRSKRLRELNQRLRATDLRLRFQRFGHANELLAQRMTQQMENRLKKMRARQDALAEQLGHLSPLNVLSRGYAIVEKQGGRVVRSAAETAEGEALKVRLGEGQLQVTVASAVQQTPEDV